MKVWKRIRTKKVAAGKKLAEYNKNIKELIEGEKQKVFNSKTPKQSSDITSLLIGLTAFVLFSYDLWVAIKRLRQHQEWKWSDSILRFFLPGAGKKKNVFTHRLPLHSAPLDLTLL